MTVLICIDGYKQHEPDPTRTAKLRDANAKHHAWIEQMLRPSLATLGPDYVRFEDREPKPDLTPVVEEKPCPCPHGGLKSSPLRCAIFRSADYADDPSTDDLG